MDKEITFEIYIKLMEAFMEDKSFFYNFSDSELQDAFNMLKKDMALNSIEEKNKIIDMYREKKELVQISYKVINQYKEIQKMMLGSEFFQKMMKEMKEMKE